MRTLRDRVWFFIQAKHEESKLSVIYEPCVISDSERCCAVCCVMIQSQRRASRDSAQRGNDEVIGMQASFKEKGARGT